MKILTVCNHGNVRSVCLARLMKNIGHEFEVINMTKMEIKLRAKYRIKGNSDYFKKKYSTTNPEIVIEDIDTRVFGFDALWGSLKGNPACVLYIARAEATGIDFNHGRSFYGKIKGLGELVHETELEEIE